MDAREIQQLRPLLNEYLHEFDDCFGRREPVEAYRVNLNEERRAPLPITDGGSVNLQGRNLIPKCRS